MQQMLLSSSGRRSRFIASSVAAAAADNAWVTGGRASGSQNRPADDPEGRGTKFCEEESVILCFTYFGHFVNALHRLLQHHTHKHGMGEFFATLNNRVNKLVEQTNKTGLIL